MSTKAALEAAATNAAEEGEKLTAARAQLLQARQNRIAAATKADFASNMLSRFDRALPGGSVRISAASSRFIAMQQEFDPPLVIGYLGFDVEIRRDGIIGPPIPTHARLDPLAQGTPFSPGTVVETLFAVGIDPLVYHTLQEAASDEKAGAKKAVEMLDALARRFVPDTYPSYQKAGDGALQRRDKNKKDTYLSFRSYRFSLERNPGAVGRVLALNKPFTLRDSTGDSTVEPNSDKWRELEGDIEAWEEAAGNPAMARRARQAAVFAGNQYIGLLLQSDGN